MEPHRPKGQASLFDLGCTKRKRTEDDGPARELIIRLRPDVQQAVAARDAAIAASIASRPAPVKRPVGRPKVLAPLGVQAPPGERHVWAQLQLRWSGGEHQVRLHLHFTAKAAAAAAAAEAQKLNRYREERAMSVHGAKVGLAKTVFGIYVYRTALGCFASN